MRLAFASALLLGLAPLALATTARDALAQPTAENKAAAEAAFRQGRDLMAKGDFQPACMAFRSSQQLDPQLGTQYNLGLCYEQAGMLASAWGELTDLAARDTNKARKKDAAARAKKLEPRLVKLLVVVRQAQAGLTLTRDGNDATPLIGVATPVDPGTSVLEANAPGFLPFTIETSLVGEGTTVTVEIPALTPKPEEPPPDLTPPDRGEIRLPPPPPPKIDPDPGKGRRRLGIIVGVVGVAALAGGGTFAFMAQSANQDAKDACGGDVTDCRGDVEAAQAFSDDASSKATLATIGIGVGAAAVVTGALLYFTAPPKRTAVETTLVPTAGPSHAGLALVGRF